MMGITALVFGLLGSMHCLGMCGPIALMLPVGKLSPRRKYFSIALYHGGRILAYALLGALVGMLGLGVAVFGYQQQLSIAAGILMMMAAVMPGLHLNLGGFDPLNRFFVWFKRQWKVQMDKKTADTFLTLGFLNGFLPCGLVYMAMAGALASGNPMEGAVYMALFGLGTVPMMTAVVLISGLLSQKTLGRWRKAIPYLLFIVGMLFVLRGLGLGIPMISPKAMGPAQGPMASIECHP